MIRVIERKNEESSEVKSGWFTPQQMKTELKWDSSLGLNLRFRMYDQLDSIWQQLFWFTLPNPITQVIHKGRLQLLPQTWTGQEFWIAILLETFISHMACAVRRWHVFFCGFGDGHCLPRNDKYSSKVKKFFVEYSDKEANKKSYAEIQKHTSKGEAHFSFKKYTWWRLLPVVLRANCLGCPAWHARPAAKFNTLENGWIHGLLWRMLMLRAERRIHMTGNLHLS